MISSPEKNVLEFGFLPGQKVVDLGSGAGHYTLPLSRAVGGEGSVYAVDINEPALIRLKNIVEADSRSNVVIVKGNISGKEGTNLRSGLVDGAVFSNILFRLEDKEGAVEEAYRILRNGGKVGVVEWGDNTPLNIYHRKTKRTVLTKDKVEDMFKERGFILDKEFDAGEHHFGLIFLKPAL